MKKGFKRLLAAACAATMLIGTFGSAAAVHADELDTSEEVQLVMYVVSDRPAGQDIVDENMNAYFKEKLNCTLQINWIGWAEYANKYPMLYSSGEKFDMAYCATWLNFANLARRGAFKDLSELLPKYAPDNFALQSESALQQATIDGALYAVPTLLPTYITYGPIYRGDIADEAGIEGDLDTWEKIEAYGDYIKANHPELEVIDLYQGNVELSLQWERFQGNFEIDSGNRYIFYDPSEEHPTVFPVYDDPTFPEFVDMCARWSEKGFWSKSALSDTDSTKTQNGKAALRFHNIDNWVNYAVIHPEWDFRYAAMTKDIAHLPYTQDCMVIPNTAEHPERALALWNLLTTDQEAYDTFFYGILGTTYEVNDEGQFRMLDSDLYQSNAMWAVRTMDLNRNQWGAPEAYDTIREGWEESIQEGVGTERFTGFVFDTTNVTTEIANCQNVRQQYGWPLELGYVDKEKGLEDYRKQMQNAGIDRIVEEAQRQLDEYIAGLEG